MMNWAEASLCKEYQGMPKRKKVEREINWAWAIAVVLITVAVIGMGMIGNEMLMHPHTTSFLSVGSL